MSSLFRRRIQTPVGEVSLVFLAASVLWMLFIWGNSTVSGSGSSALSHSTLDTLKEVLTSWGIPCAWLTNFLVRKTAHVLEYALLGLLVSQAFGSGASLRGPRLGATLLVLVLVPAIDETIQLFTPGRSGMFTDVLIDCCGATFGVLVRTLAVSARLRRVNRG